MTHEDFQGDALKLLKKNGQEVHTLLLKEFEKDKEAWMQAVKRCKQQLIERVHEGEVEMADKDLDDRLNNSLT